MQFIDIHTHKSHGNKDVIEIVNLFPADSEINLPLFSVGLHPWHVDENTIDADLKLVIDKLAHKNCVAIGEFGLDSKIDIPAHLQNRVFERQMQFAEEYKKPILIHCVGSFSKLIYIKNRLKLNVPIIVHGFSKNIRQAQTLINKGFYISFGRMLLKSENTQNCFVQLPIEKLFLETDKAQDSIEDIYIEAAKLKNISVEELKANIWTNFNTVFPSIRL